MSSLVNKQKRENINREREREKLDLIKIKLIRLIKFYGLFLSTRARYGHVLERRLERIHAIGLAPFAFQSQLDNVVGQTRVRVSCCIGHVRVTKTRVLTIAHGVAHSKRIPVVTEFVLKMIRTHARTAVSCPLSLRGSCALSTSELVFVRRAIDRVASVSRLQFQFELLRWNVLNTIDYLNNFFF